MSKLKILWHSSQPVSKFPDYTNAILGHAKKVLGPEVELVIRGVEKGTPDTQFFAFDFLNNAEFFQSVVRAEKEGFDAVALGCFLDPILDEFKEIMQIPVMGMAEAGLALTRWADDFVVVCQDVAKARRALQLAEEFLCEQLGVTLHSEKTRIVHVRHQVGAQAVKSSL